MLNHNKHYSLRASVIFIAILSFSFPFTGAGLHNLLFWLAIIFFGLSGNYRQATKLVRDEPVIRSGLFLFGFLSLSLIWHGASAESFAWLMKYKEFLLLPILVSILSQKNSQNLVFTSFLIGLLLTLYASYFIYFDLFRPNGNWNSLNARILHGLQMNVLLSFALYQIISKQKWRIFWSITSLLIITNLIIMEPGRTSQIMLVLNTLFFVFLIGKKINLAKKIVMLLAILTVSVLVAKYTDMRTLNNISHFDSSSITFSYGKSSTLPYPHNVFEDHLSIRNLDNRAAFYINGLHLIINKPFGGYGLGNTGLAYEKLKNAQATYGMQDIYPTTVNLHQQLLQISTEVGLLGGVLFVLFVYRLLRFAIEAKNPLVFSVFLITAIQTSFNSSFLDHGDGWVLMLIIALAISYKNSMAKSTSGF